MKRGIKTELIKLLPNNKELIFTDGLGTFNKIFNVNGDDYIIWGIQRCGTEIWVELEDSSGFMFGRYYSPLVDTPTQLYPHIIDFVKKKLNIN